MLLFNKSLIAIIVESIKFELYYLILEAEQLELRRLDLTSHTNMKILTSFHFSYAFHSSVLGLTENKSDFSKDRFLQLPAEIIQTKDYHSDYIISQKP